MIGHDNGMPIRNIFTPDDLGRNAAENKYEPGGVCRQSMAISANKAHRANTSQAYRPYSARVTTVT